MLARQVTYEKITQRLVGLKLSEPVPPGRRLLAEGKPAGVITSVAISPRFGAIALGVVKRPHYMAGTRLEVEVQGIDQPVDAITFEPPFHKPLV